VLKLKRIKWEGMEVLVDEGKDAIEKIDKGPVRDAALICSFKQKTQYEIAAYGTLCAMAGELGYKDALPLLKASLEEEKSTDEKLTMLAEGGGNQRAAKAA